MVLFEDAADEYGAARPSYPPELYDFLESIAGPLAEMLVLDAGAGTGIATRQLAGRGATVIALDAGVGMLTRAVSQSPGLRAVAADAAAMPLRGGRLDLLCFAQSWHWVNQAAGAAEAARVLRRGGWWAAWWNHPWADGEGWFEAHQALLERSCPGYSREQRDVDWAQASVAGQGGFCRPERHIVPWERVVSVASWITDLSSHSYVLALAAQDRRKVLEGSEAIARGRFPDGRMSIPYQTRLWLARRS